MNDAIRILVAEDNPDDIFLLKQACKKAGVTAPFYAVSDGLELLSYLQGSGAYSDRTVFPFPDVLLLDLNMPRRNGFEVLSWIRSNLVCSRLMVHVFTASARETDVQRAYDLHANSYVVKPTRMDELVAFVASLHSWHSFAVIAGTAEKPVPAAKSAASHARPRGA